MPGDTKAGAAYLERSELSYGCSIFPLGRLRSLALRSCSLRDGPPKRRGRNFLCCSSSEPGAKPACICSHARPISTSNRVHDRGSSGIPLLLVSLTAPSRRVIFQQVQARNTTYCTTYYGPIQVPKPKRSGNNWYVGPFCEAVSFKELFSPAAVHAMPSKSQVQQKLVIKSYASVRIEMPREKSKLERKTVSGTRSIPSAKPNLMTMMCCSLKIWQRPSFPPTSHAYKNRAREQHLFPPSRHEGNRMITQPGITHP